MDSCAPTILQSRVQIPSTPSTHLKAVFKSIQRNDYICHCVENWTKINIWPIFKQELNLDVTHKW